MGNFSPMHSRTVHMVFVSFTLAVIADTRFVMMKTSSAPPQSPQLGLSRFTSGIFALRCTTFGDLSRNTTLLFVRHSFVSLPSLGVLFAFSIILTTPHAACKVTCLLSIIMGMHYAGNYRKLNVPKKRFFALILQTFPFQSN